MWLGSPLQILWSVHNDLQMCCEMRRVTLNCTHDSIMAGPRASNPLSLVDFVQPAHHACPLPKTLPLIWLEQSKKIQTQKHTNTQINKYTNTHKYVQIRKIQMYQKCPSYMHRCSDPPLPSTPNPACTKRQYVNTQRHKYKNANTDILCMMPAPLLHPSL